MRKKGIGVGGESVVSYAKKKAETRKQVTSTLNETGL